MDNKKMECFIQLYEEKNFSVAAEKMYMAQSSFSSNIKNIEEELGVLLVDRSNKREVFFTKEGDLFYEYCKTNLKEYNHFVNQIRSLSSKPIKNIGLFYSSRLDNWTRKIATYNETTTDSKFGILFSYGKEKVNQILNGDCFITMSVKNPELEKLGYNFHHLYSDYDSLGLSYSHPLASKEKIVPEDLKDITIHVISPKKTFAVNKGVNLLIEKYGLKPYNFKYLNKIGDLHYSMKTENAVIMMPADLMPESCKIIKLNFDEGFKLDYGWYYKEMNDDVKWVLENL